ncbi:MAG: DUF255 domain-containing protein [Saprospiraceae bacterium]|nr:DUF255 domain-containing protein [Saprospiraceae bacterium]
MKLFYSIIFFSIFIISSSFKSIEREPTVNWITWDEAVALQKVKPKKVMVDIYTKWCGWCKKMDSSTFLQPNVVNYINTNFYAVKFDAESDKQIIFDNHLFQIMTEGNSKVHELAYSLLDGKMTYPSIVYLNENWNRILISPGFKDEGMILKELKYLGDDIYLKQTWPNYDASYMKN